MICLTNKISIIIILLLASLILYNYFCENCRKIVSGSYEDFDYSLYFNDLQNCNVSDELSVAEVVGLFSALSNKPVMPSTVVCGRVVMSGSMMPITTELEEIIISVANAGAKKILLPMESRPDFESLSHQMKKEVEAIFYSTPLDAVRKMLGM